MTKKAISIVRTQKQPLKRFSSKHPSGHSQPYSLLVLKLKHAKALSLRQMTNVIQA